MGMRGITVTLPARYVTPIDPGPNVVPKVPDSWKYKFEQKIEPVEVKLEDRYSNPKTNTRVPGTEIKSAKVKRPRLKEGYEPEAGGGSRGKKILRPMVYIPKTMGELVADRDDRREWADRGAWSSREEYGYKPMQAFIRHYVEDFVHNKYPVRGVDVDEVEKELWRRIGEERGLPIDEDTPTYELDDYALNYLYRTVRDIIRKFASRSLGADVAFPDDEM